MVYSWSMWHPIWCVYILHHWCISSLSHTLHHLMEYCLHYHTNHFYGSFLLYYDINTNGIIYWLSHSSTTSSNHLISLILSDSLTCICSDWSWITSLVLTNLIELHIILRMFIKCALKVSSVLINWSLLIVFHYSPHIVLFHQIPLFLRLYNHRIRRGFWINTIPSCHFHYIIDFLLIIVV